MNSTPCQERDSHIETPAAHPLERPLRLSKIRASSRTLDGYILDPMSSSNKVSTTNSSNNKGTQRTTTTARAPTPPLENPALPTTVTVHTLSTATTVNINNNADTENSQHSINLQYNPYAINRPPPQEQLTHHQKCVKAREKLDKEEKQRLKKEQAAKQRAYELAVTEKDRQEQEAQARAATTARMKAAAEEKAREQEELAAADKIEAAAAAAASISAPPPPPPDSSQVKATMNNDNDKPQHKVKTKKNKKKKKKKKKPPPEAAPLPNPHSKRPPAVTPQQEKTSDKAAGSRALNTELPPPPRNLAAPSTAAPEGLAATPTQNPSEEEAKQEASPAAASAATATTGTLDDTATGNPPSSTPPGPTPGVDRVARLPADGKEEEEEEEHNLQENASASNPDSHTNQKYNFEYSVNSEEEDDGNGEDDDDDDSSSEEDSSSSSQTSTSEQESQVQDHAQQHTEPLSQGQSAESQEQTSVHDAIQDPTSSFIKNLDTEFPIPTGNFGCNGQTDSGPPPEQWMLDLQNKTTDFDQATETLIPKTHLREYLTKLRGTMQNLTQELDIVASRLHKAKDPNYIHPAIRLRAELDLPADAGDNREFRDAYSQLQTQFEALKTEFEKKGTALILHKFKFRRSHLILIRVDTLLDHLIHEFASFRSFYLRESARENQDTAPVSDQTSDTKHLAILAVWKLIRGIDQDTLDYLHVTRTALEKHFIHTHGHPTEENQLDKIDSECVEQVFKEMLMFIKPITVTYHKLKKVRFKEKTAEARTIQRMEAANSANQQETVLQAIKKDAPSLPKTPPTLGKAVATVIDKKEREKAKRNARNKANKAKKAAEKVAKRKATEDPGPTKPSKRTRANDTTPRSNPRAAVKPPSAKANTGDVDKAKKKQ